MPVNKELNFEMGIVLYDLLKIYSFLIDEYWDPEYVSWILNEGEAGYGKVLVSMNRLEKTTKDIKKSALVELYNCLILEDINRNVIHDLLWQYRKKQVTPLKDIEEIQEEVERWTMGEITREDFKANIRNNIDNLS